MIFVETETFFKKPIHQLLAESSRIESASFSNKTAISKANVKRDRIVSTI